MKILVAGGAGFIGSHLCEKLLVEGHEVICVDNFITGSEKNVNHYKKNEKFTLLKHDVTRPLPQDIHAGAVFHLASPASPNHHSPLSYHNLPMETMSVNTIGTLELLKFVMQNEAKFLFASSSEVYGDPLEHPQKETYFGNVSTSGPRSVYDEAKRFGETITFHFFRKHKTDVRIARIFNTYGPKMLKDDMRMIITFILEALQGRPITIFGDGQQTRSLCHVEDMVDGLKRLMFSSNTRGQIINLGSTEEHTVLEYAEMIKKLTKSKSSIVFSEKLPQGDPKKRKPDIAKAKEILNWQPLIKLEEGLGRMIDYCKENIL